MADPAPPVAPAPPHPPGQNPFSPAAALLERPDAQRVQEFRYRFGQSVVFGLPVMALQWLGPSLGGSESGRWVTLFQAILAGWIVYVAATGMLAEGVMLLLAGRRLAWPVVADSVVAGVSVVLYGIGLPRLIALLAGYRRAATWPAPFAAAVVLLAVWSGLRWAQKRSSAA